MFPAARETPHLGDQQECTRPRRRHRRLFGSLTALRNDVASLKGLACFICDIVALRELMLMENDRDVAAVRMRDSLPALKASLMEHYCLPMIHTNKRRYVEQWSIKICSQEIGNL